MMNMGGGAMPPNMYGGGGMQAVNMQMQMSPGGYGMGPVGMGGMMGGMPPQPHPQQMMHHHQQRAMPGMSVPMNHPQGMMAQVPMQMQMSPMGPMGPMGPMMHGVSPGRQGPMPPNAQMAQRAGAPPNRMGGGPMPMGYPMGPQGMPQQGMPQGMGAPPQGMGGPPPAGMGPRSGFSPSGGSPGYAPPPDQ